jgi:hypothetical protein
VNIGCTERFRETFIRNAQVKSLYNDETGSSRNLEFENESRMVKPSNRPLVRVPVPNIFWTFSEDMESKIFDLTTDYV